MGLEHKSIVITPATGSPSGILPKIVFSGFDNQPITLFVNDNNTLDFKNNSGTSILQIGTSSVNVPTASAGTNSTQIASTQFVQTALANLNNESLSHRNVYSSTAILSSDDALFVYCDSNSVTLIAPTAIGNGGKKIYIKKVSGANLLVIQSQAGQTIDGQQNISLEYLNQAITLISDNTNWFVF